MIEKKVMFMQNKKILSMSELSRSTYARFSNNGVVVDLSSFLKTPTAQKMFINMRQKNSCKKPK